MPSAYSPELIARAQRIFAKRSGRVVDIEETELYLDQLARLGLLAVKAIPTGRKEVEPYGKA